LNQTAIELGAEPGVPTLFDVKVRSSVSGGVPMISESSITISVNTYSGLIAYSFTWYLMVQQFKEAGIIMQTRITNQCLETEQLLTNTLYGILWRRKL
jgi:hypothetical protein